jgi:hypothetical protein
MTRHQPRDRVVLRERNTNMDASRSETSSTKTKRRLPTVNEGVPLKKSKKREKEPVKVEASNDDTESDEEENAQTTYSKRITLRNRMYKTVDDIETAERRLENGDDDNSAVNKAVKHYSHSEILKDEYRSIVNGRDLSIDGILGDRLSRVLLIRTGKISSGSKKFKFNDFGERAGNRGTFAEFYRYDLDGMFDPSINFRSLTLIDFGAPPKAKKAPAERISRKTSKKGDLVDVKGKQTNEIAEEKDADFTRQLDHVMKAFRENLKARKTDRLNYYEFVVDPQDFGTTIQNSFCVAFLLKDARLFLEKKEGEPHPILRKLTKAEKEDAQKVQDEGKPLPTNQCINTLTFTKWKGIIRMLKLKKPLIKPEK